MAKRVSAAGVRACASRAPGGWQGRVQGCWRGPEAAPHRRAVGPRGARRLTCENARQPQPPPRGVGVRAEGAGGARAERRGPQRPAHSTARAHESSLPSETRAGRRAFSS